MPVSGRDRFDQLPGIRVLRAKEHLLHGPLLHNFAPLHDNDPLAELADDLHIVGNKQDRHTGGLVDLLQQFQDLGLDGHVECRRGFIRKQKLRTVNDGGGDHAALQHAAGKLVRVFIVDGLRIIQLRIRERLQGCLLPFRLGHFRMVHKETLLHLLSNLHDRVKRAHRLLEDHADVLALELSHLLAVTVQDLPSVEQDLALITAVSADQKAADRHSRNRLAGAAFPDNPEDAAGLHTKADAVHRIAVRRRIIEMHPQILHFQHFISPPEGFPSEVFLRSPPQEKALHRKAVLLSDRWTSRCRSGHFHQAATLHKSETPQRPRSRRSSR